MESSSKQATFGKMIFKIYVTDTTGKKLGFWRACARNFLKLLTLCVLINCLFLWQMDSWYWGSLFLWTNHYLSWNNAGAWCSPTFLIVIAFFNAFGALSKNKQLIHDFFAQTYVLRKFNQSLEPSD